MLPHVALGAILERHPYDVLHGQCTFVRGAPAPAVVWLAANAGAMEVGAQALSDSSGFALAASTLAGSLSSLCLPGRACLRVVSDRGR